MEEQWCADRSRLRTLLHEHPDWSTRDLAAALGRRRLGAPMRRPRRRAERRAVGRRQLAQRRGDDLRAEAVGDRRPGEADDRQPGLRAGDGQRPQRRPAHDAAARRDRIGRSRQLGMDRAGAEALSVNHALHLLSVRGRDVAAGQATGRMVTDAM
jgi:hypothetical protein